MKKLVLFVIVCLATVNSNAQEKNPDTLLRKVFSAIKTRDEKAFVSLFPSYIQLQGLTSEIIGSIKDSSARAEAQKGLGEITEETWNQAILAEIKKDFSDCLEDLEKRKLTPGQLHFVDVKYEQDDKGPMATQLKNIKGTFYFTHAGEEFEISFTDVLWSEKAQGWFGIGLHGLRKKGEPEADETDSVAVKDVILEDVEVPPPPPPPPPKKPASKTPAKSPAKKPKT